MASNNVQDFKIETKRIRLSDIRFNESVYPRKNGHNPTIVERYAGEIEEIEAAGAYITVAADMDLLDGRHRWLGYLTAYQSEPDREIPARIAEVSSEADKYLLAVRLNSRHGFAFSADDRQHSAIQLYNLGWPVETVARELSVKTATVSGWLSRTIKENRDAANRKIKAMWLACYTNQEIADAVGLSIGQVNTKVKVFSVSFPGKETENTDQNSDEVDSAVGGGLKPSKSDVASAMHESDFDPPTYNIWKQQEKSNAVGHFGNSEQRWLDNLLYLYTKPLDIVIDPFAGGGSTIDVCKKRWRRYWAGDRRPKVSRDADNELGGIRKHDLVSESSVVIPDLRGRWENVRLVYLDPPYWKQAAGEYSDDPTDLANMDLETFNKTLSGLINAFAKKLHPGAVIALIIQPTQWKAPERQFTDHVGDMLRAVKRWQQFIPQERLRAKAKEMWEALEEERERSKELFRALEQAKDRERELMLLIETERKKPRKKTGNGIESRLSLFADEQSPF